MKLVLLLLFPFFFIACTESSVEVISGPELFTENDFYVTEVNEENRARVKELDIIWKEATFGEVLEEPTFKDHQLKTIVENGETTYWLTGVSTDNCIDIASKLEKTPDGFIMGATNTGKICACIGCAEGCQLTIEDGRCLCETYTPSDNNCEKLEMVEVEM